MSEAVKVVVRCRPLNSKEKGEGRKPIPKINIPSRQIELPNVVRPEDPPKRFTFDAVCVGRRHDTGGFCREPPRRPRPLLLSTVRPPFRGVPQTPPRAET